MQLLHITYHSFFMYGPQVMLYGCLLYYKDINEAYVICIKIHLTIETLNFYTYILLVQSIFNHISIYLCIYLGS